MTRTIAIAEEQARAAWLCPKCKRPATSTSPATMERPALAVCVPCDYEEPLPSLALREAAYGQPDPVEAMDLAAGPDRTAIRAVVTTAFAVELLGRYLEPMLDFVTLEVDLELAEVIDLLRPDLEEWTWALDEEELRQGVLGLVGDGAAAEVRVDQWDAHLGDEGWATGYRVEIKARARQLEAAAAGGAPSVQ